MAVLQYCVFCENAHIISNKHKCSDYKQKDITMSDGFSTFDKKKQEETFWTEAQVHYKQHEPHLAIPMSMVMEIYKELSYLTNAASNANLAERLLKMVKGENNG